MSDKKNGKMQALSLDDLDQVSGGYSVSTNTTTNTEIQINKGDTIDAVCMDVDKKLGRQVADNVYKVLNQFRGIKPYSDCGYFTNSFYISIEDGRVSGYHY